MIREKCTLLIYFILFRFIPAMTQISPGELAQAHSHLEGISNCTRCHILGEKVSNEKCLACHGELKSRIDQNKGYHSSTEIKGKNCVTCHSDHHGRNFQLVRFSRENFNHNLTGFPLEGAHAKKVCVNCHKTEFIAGENLKKKKFTFLGLNRACISCHADYHQKSLSSNCSDCHGPESFAPAVKFSHTRSGFQLTGKHQKVTCVKCHKVSTKEGKKYQEFTGLQYKNCNSCHSDPHKNQFGPNCSECHSTESFYAVREKSNFDHTKTGFPLENMHARLACKACHKTRLTDPVKHGRCADCHKDYHTGQFSKQGSSPDCSSCHTTKGFTESLFTIEQHNSGPFPLHGAHLATACNDCHKKTEKWSFRNIGSNCSDCHVDIHDTYLSTRYYPGSNCLNCHTSESWSRVNFDHSATSYPLSGSHARVNCRACHFRTDDAGKVRQQFAGLSGNCANCHEDIHQGQFENQGTTDCLRCHISGFWNMDQFDHNKTGFILDGQHKEVACSGCHKNRTDGENTYVIYKIKETKCENCH